MPSLTAAVRELALLAGVVAVLAGCGKIGFHDKVEVGVADGLPVIISCWSDDQLISAAILDNDVPLWLATRTTGEGITLDRPVGFSEISRASSYKIVGELPSEVRRSFTIRVVTEAGYLSFDLANTELPMLSDVSCD